MIEDDEFEDAGWSDVVESAGIEDSEALSFQEIYAMLQLNEEIIITIPVEDIERVKTGLKNYKAKKALKEKEAGLPPESPSTLTFEVEKNTEYPNAADMRVILTRKAVVKVMNIKIPDKEF